MTVPEPAPRKREAVRALLISPDREILLMRTVMPTQGDRVGWITPGGGLEPGEDALAGLRRELREETGLSDPAIGPEVWTRRHSFRVHEQTWNQHGRFFLVGCERFEPSIEQMQEVERDYFQTYRWWPIDEIENSGELFAPGQIGRLLDGLLRDGPPKQPIDTGA